MENTTLQLEKLTCPSCMQKIKNTVDELEGVEKIKILFEASKARVYFDQSTITTEEIIENITKIGYAAEEIK